MGLFTSFIKAAVGRAQVTLRSVEADGESSVGVADAPAYVGADVTPSDSTVLTKTRALYVGTGGNVAVVFATGSTAVTLKNVNDGSILPIGVTKVMLTNTTASDIVALR